MPQLTLRYCSIADVTTADRCKNLDGNGNKKDKVVKINIDEEDFFDMLDSINPKNIIKYLDMRGIPHREALQVNIRPIDVDTLPSRYSKEYSKAIGRLVAVEARNAKKQERIEKLVAMYEGKAKIKRCN